MKKLLIVSCIVVVAAVVYAQRGAVRSWISAYQQEGLPDAVSYEQWRQKIETGAPSNSEIDADGADANQEQTGERTQVRDTGSPAGNVAVDDQFDSDQQAPAPARAAQPPAVSVMPRQINLAVPFQAQAPFANWVEPYKEGCEEASLIMVDYYLRGAALSKQQMQDAIDEQVAWQHAAWGGHFDEPVARVAELAAQFYPYTTLIIHDLTAEKIREQLQKGRPVIVPAAGRELGNPNFRTPGPLYHMLVVKGYTSYGQFITNDPGTRNGADYVYDEAVLMSAIRDWDMSSKNPDGPKVGLVMYQ